MDRKEFEKDLKIFALRYNQLLSAIKKYDEIKIRCRKYLNSENQINHIENEISLTRIHLRNIRKIRENECRQAKKELKLCQRLFTEIQNKLFKEVCTNKGVCLWKNIIMIITKIRQKFRIIR